ncbi:hypothetical protein CAPTEDRAFT_229382 [Capitella teleta]|uniref:Uncharacterized protein n=1 Tax=Capitella teleta TaxID=283909 RepID=R7UEX8_CAPTE|nr:hypothetical protein CAPTEDRAFT_229382 [Capitella teleta]|eukprot:ELU05069.1 hypothetical protein CAPTEDRAFT_229382 [Capitella teleta]
MWVSGFADLFDKVDVTKEGTVDWDKFASHMLLEFYERDNRVKSTQVPQWKDLRTLPSPHKEIIQRLAYLKNSNRYISISKEGCVSMWGQNLKLQRNLKTGTDTCRARDLWMTDFIPLQNINKIALAFTSKEIAIYDLSAKLEFNCQFKVQGMEHTPLSLEYWSNPMNVNEAILTWGDTSGAVNALHFNSANIALFERPPAPSGEKQETCLNVHLKDVIKKKYKSARFTKHQGHSEWVRQVKYSANLECFISCATTWNNSLVIGWMEKHQSNQNMKTEDNNCSILPKEVVRTTTFQLPQGVNGFDYHEQLNLIATAGVNHHVCLWNPYVVSKPNGVLRGHMASVIQVQFNKCRNQLISFSKDKVLRIWDVQLQVAIQRLAGMFPKGPEVSSILYFDERMNRLFITFNYQLTVMEMKVEITDRVMSHEKPVVAALYNATYNQVVSACQGGTIIMWMADTGQKVKQFTQAHGNSEVTTLAQDHSQTRIYTGSTDGTVKIWDFNGHCYHTLHCGSDGQPADIGQILSLKRSLIVVGWARYITVFRDANFRDFHIEPSDWKGGQEHQDDILALAFSGPNTLASGSYDGEIVTWNNNSEQASKHLNQRGRKLMTRQKTFSTLRDMSSDLGFESCSNTNMRGRPKSRTASRLSTEEEANEYGFAITCLAFLTGRKGSSAKGGANLVSCGGNGWVRFWNTNNNKLLAEFTAHSQVGSLVMVVDEHSHWMATGDVDGLIKVWDISQYCMYDSEDSIITTPPPLKSQFIPHIDALSTLEIFVRNERTLILSASADCSVQLWDIYGNQIGVFGQEGHWKVEPYNEQDEVENEDRHNEEDEIRAEVEADHESEWEPDELATERPEDYRINTWEKTHLGKDYQELRVRKRERRQPEIIKDLPYLHWEKTGQPPAGPFAALNTTELSDVGTLNQPDFMHHPHRYFSERPSTASQNKRLPSLAETLNAAFDEKSLFPKYIMDFENKMKHHHTRTLAEAQKRAGAGVMRATLGGGNSSMTVQSQRTTATSPNKRPPPSKPHKLKPLSQRPESIDA